MHGRGQRTTDSDSGQWITNQAVMNKINTNERAGNVVLFKAGYKW
ncbi:hypothetical protein Back11_48960 [Paenibacillus baekrokdamisoli]|uniref:Uncharacterized protein n=1 Tax=Paenibacillus baekrokdamisoli TaxID=1712516 RepID=A0A3G9JC90_9BACL|nr:hypothetical protein Back11_48960 [Paenibacillus baekrokdamisoli]